MFERTLSDLIRGLRASNKKDEAKFIALAVDEIRNEVKSKDMELKAAAVLKLTYLEMLGYDMSWASFHVVEVMSSSRFHLKSVGYLAAVQSFKEDTDVLMLTTNTLKKDIASSHPEDIATALDGLSHIVTPDLGRDLSHDLIAMLNHSRPRIRKRAVLIMYKIFLKYPEVLPHAFTRLREKLDDTDPGVVSATVNILCELARKDPQDYLPLAPQLFEILTKSTNNWMLIKVIKLLGALAPFEPRLVKKLQKPITDLITTTPAVSLLYECVHTCIIGGMLHGSSGASLAKLCADKLAAFLRDSDQNLKYISLLALAKIVPTQPHLVSAYQEEIMSSVDDPDISIRMRALELVSSMVTDYNLQSIVQKLLSYLVPSEENASANLPSAAQSLARAAAASDGLNVSQPRPSLTGNANTETLLSSAYRLEVGHRIIEMCSRDSYENVTDFEWYLSVLVDLAYISNVATIGEDIKAQLLDVTLRVRAIRPFAVGLMLKLLNDDILLENCRDETSCSEVLWAAAWICGEYCTELPNPQEVLKLLLQPNVTLLPNDTVAVYLQSALKVFGHWAASISDSWDEDFLPETKRQVDEISSNLGRFISSTHIEVQERAANMIQLFAFIKADLGKHSAQAEAPSPPAENSSTFTEPQFPKSLYLIRPLHNRELNAVAPQAQRSVKKPDGLSFDVEIVHSSRLVADDDVDPSEVEELVASSARRKKKGKGKAEGGLENEAGKTKGRSSKRKKKDAGPSDVPAVVETPEEIAARAKRRAERAAQQRDNPYYLVDDQPSSHVLPDQEAIDSIPIVRLDDLPSPDKGIPLSGPRASLLTRSSYASLRTASSTPVIVERGGDMPPGTTTTSTPSASFKSPSILSASRSSSGTPLSGKFVPYEVDDAAASSGVSTPEPIRVTKVKKKSTAKKKVKVASP